MLTPPLVRYDREKELNEIFDALRCGERLIVIMGMRRAGKSSVLRVSLKEAKIPHAIIDMKGIRCQESDNRWAEVLKCAKN